MQNKKKWFVSNRKADFETLSRQHGVSPITIRCIINRGVDPKDIKKYLYGKRTDMYNPKLLLNAEIAAIEIKEAIKEKKKIRIIGDYDVDGEMSTTILRTGIERCGGNVDYAIPDRIIDGYGLNENLVRKAIEDGINLIVTCDNGIAAFNQIQLANENGVEVIITDHHEVPYVENEAGERDYIIPPAKVVVNPKLPNDTYPQKGICGAVVAYKVIEILYSLYRVPKKELENLLMFAAIATVCDVMELSDENRIIVREGLAILNSTNHVGIKALIDACGLSEKTITAGHLGFVIGPTCNAAGRLQSATLAIELMFETDCDKALEKAQGLRAINQQRKDMTETNTALAFEIIENSSLKDDKVLVVNLDSCHESLAGIIAGKVRERYCKPAIVFTKTEDGYKGSGRSIEAYNMFEELNKIKPLFVKFGGHPMAAGMSVESYEKLEEVRSRLNELTTLTEDDFCEVSHIDAELPFQNASLALAQELTLLEPFGVGNAAPLFGARNINFTRALEMGANHNAMRYYIKGMYDHKYCLYDFGNIDLFINHLKARYGETVMDDLKVSSRNDVVETIIYKVSINHYKGNDTLQMILDNFK